MTVRTVKIATLENDIENTRGRISDTIDALGDKLSPSRMFYEAMSFSRAGGGQLVGSLASMAKQHPLPVTLLSIGAGLLVMAQRNAKSGNAQYATSTDTGAHGAFAQNMRDKAHDMRQRAHDMQHKAQEKAHDMMDRARSGMDRARTNAADMRERAMESGYAAMDTVQQSATRWAETTQQLMQENPLAAGAAMIAVGALIGGSLPMSERERQMLGASGRKAKDLMSQAAARSEAAADIAHAAMEQGRQTVEDIAQTTKDRGPVLH